MGAGYSCASAGTQLQSAVHEGDAQVVAKVLTSSPAASVHHTLLDRTSAMHIAAAKGHADVIMLLLETAVAIEGPVRAKKLCINHVNASGESALMLASMNGHADCVEVLLGNGADPLRRDYNTHNTCLHFAALNGHSNCVAALLSNSALYEAECTGVAFPIAQYPCQDDDGTSLVKFVDRHNGWGLTALHLAAINGNADTVRALLRGGASLVGRSATPGLAGAPAGCPKGATALHLAAKFGHIGVMRVLMEEQDLQGQMDIRTVQDDLHQLPIDYARAAGQSPVLVRLLDETVPVAAMRRLWLSSSNGGTPALSSVLEMLLHRLKLMLTLEMAALQTARSSHPASACPAGACSTSSFSQSPRLREGIGGHDLAPGGCMEDDDEDDVGVQPLGAEMGEEGRHLVRLRQLQAAINRTLDLLHQLVNAATGPTTAQPEPQPTTSGQESDRPTWLIDLLLASLVSPREVSAILRAARNLIASSQLAPEAAPSTSHPAMGAAASSSPTQQQQQQQQQGDSGAGYPADSAQRQLESALQEVHGCLQAGIAGLKTSSMSQGTAGHSATSRFRGVVMQDPSLGRASMQSQESSAHGYSKPRNWSWSQLSLSFGRSHSGGPDSESASEAETSTHHVGSPNGGIHGMEVPEESTAAEYGEAAMCLPGSSSSIPDAPEVAEGQASPSRGDQPHLCPICMDRRISVSIQSCRHTMCLHCAFQICCKGRQAPLCPFCRQSICSFIT